MLGKTTIFFLKISERRHFYLRFCISMSDLRKDSWIPFLLLHPVCCGMLIWLKYMETIQPYRHVIEKKRTLQTLNRSRNQKEFLDHTLRTNGVSENLPPSIRWSPKPSQSQKNKLVVHRDLTKLSVPPAHNIPRQQYPSNCSVETITWDFLFVQTQWYLGPSTRQTE